MKKLPTILLYTFLGLSCAYLLVLTLGLFNVFELTAIASESFNYIVAYIVLLLALAIYILFMLAEKWRSWIVPAWLKSLFFVAFFVFTNVYYFFGLYQTLAGIIVFDICLASLLNIVAVSLFYNTQKDSKNSVKTTEKFLCFSTFCYAITGGVFYQIIALAIRLISKSSGLLSSIALVITELCILIAVSLIFALLFALSMKGKRKFVNGCLVKYIPVSEYKNNKTK